MLTAGSVQVVAAWAGTLGATSVNSTAASTLHADRGMCGLVLLLSDIGFSTMLLDR
jgi:hypothetical protein